MRTRLVRLSAPSAWDHTDSPALQWGSVGREELLSLQIPAARSAWSCITLAELHFGCGKQTSIHDFLGLRHPDSVRLEDWIVLVVKYSQTCKYVSKGSSGL